MIGRTGRHHQKAGVIFVFRTRPPRSESTSRAVDPGRERARDRSVPRASLFSLILFGALGGICSFEGREVGVAREEFSRFDGATRECERAVWTFLDFLSPQSHNGELDAARRLRLRPFARDQRSSMGNWVSNASGDRIFDRHQIKFRFAAGQSVAKPTKGFALDKFQFAIRKVFQRGHIMERTP